MNTNHPACPLMNQAHLVVSLAQMSTIVKPKALKPSRLLMLMVTNMTNLQVFNDLAVTTGTK